MKRLVIEIPEAGDESQVYDVVDDKGRRAGGLSFDEMLGQVVAMTHAQLGTPRYPMKLAAEWDKTRFADIPF